MLGDNAQAITAQSVNGGGGTLTFDVSGITDLPGTPRDAGSQINVLLGGGNIGSNASSSTVVVRGSGRQVVAGAGGSGSGIQSIGGGGGTATYKFQFVPAADTVAPAGSLTAATPVLSTLAVFALGNFGSSASNGAEASLTHTGEVATLGIDTPGQIVQSIGGGGGRLNVALDISKAAPEIFHMALGASVPVSSPGDSISVLQNGAVTTVGRIAPGALLQSIGGGGGSAASWVSAGAPLGPGALVSLGANGGTGADGGPITARYSGGIRTFGDNSVGLMAQSIGGGGGELRLADISANSVIIGGMNRAAGNGAAIDIEQPGRHPHRGRAFARRAVAIDRRRRRRGARRAVQRAVLRNGGIGDGGAIELPPDRRDRRIRGRSRWRHRAIDRRRRRLG